nr:MAG TPA: hypothetical protein [Caudoviricetes sp.]
MYFRRTRAECFCFFLLSLGSSCRQVFFMKKGQIRGNKRKL